MEIGFVGHKNNILFPLQSGLYLLKYILFWLYKIKDILREYNLGRASGYISAASFLEPLWDVKVVE
jgi:hypothetical protein